MTTPRNLDRVCCVCARPAIGLGVASSHARKFTDILWCCDDPECIRIGNLTVGLKQLEFGRLDSLATDDAGAAIEGYCDEIGKTDLRDLSDPEWRELCRRFISSYRDALQTKLRNEAPF